MALQVSSEWNQKNVSFKQLYYYHNSNNSSNFQQILPDGGQLLHITTTKENSFLEESYRMKYRLSKVQRQKTVE